MPTLPLYLFALLTVPAFATSFYELPFPVSVQQAPVIVHGVIGAKKADWGVGADGARRIYTYYDLQSEEVIKGEAAGGTLSIRELGGQKDGVGMQVSGVAEFSTGEDTVVFLGPRNRDGSFDVWGMMMGKFSLQKDADGNETLVGPGMGGGGDGDEQPHQANEDAGHSAPNRKTWTMSALRQLVRDQAAATPSNVNSPTPAPAVSAKAPEPQRKILPTPSVAPMAADTASPLQPTEGETHSSGWLGGWLTLGLLLGGLGTFVILRRR